MTIRRTPFTPIFRQYIQYGSIDVGSTPGTALPPGFSTLASRELWFDSDINSIRALSDGLAVFSGNYHITILDMTGSVPVFVSRRNTSGDQPAANGQITVYGDYLFVALASGANSMAIYNISNRSSIQFVQAVADADSTHKPYTLSMSSASNLMVAGSQSGSKLLVWDITDPEAPTFEGSLTDATRFNTTLGKIAFSTDGQRCFPSSFPNDRVASVDLSTPSAPSVSSDYVNSTNMNAPYDTFLLSSGRVCAYATDRLTSLSVSGGGALSFHSQAVVGTNAAGRATMTNDYVYAYSPSIPGIRVFDPTSFWTTVYPFAMGGGSASLNQIDAVGSYVFGADYQGAGLASLDTTTPTLPTVDIDYIELWGWTVGGGNLISVTPTRLVNCTIVDQFYGIFDDPTDLGAVEFGDNIIELSSYVGMSGPSWDGTYLYLASGGTDSVLVNDISGSPPSNVGLVTDVSLLQDVRVTMPFAPNHVAAGTANGVLTLVDKSTPSFPTVDGSVNLSAQGCGFISNMATSGDIVYVNDGSQVFVADCSTTASPSYVSTIAISAYGGIAVYGSYLYLMGDDLNVYDISSPSTPSLVATQSINSGEGAYYANLVGSWLVVESSSAPYSESLILAYNLAASPTSPTPVSVASMDTGFFGALPITQHGHLLATDFDGNIKLYKVTVP